MTPSRSFQWSILGALALLMFASRFQPVEHFLELPDASWAVFFIAGYYLRGAALWAFPLLMLEAVAIDWFATSQMGVSAYCMSPAYAFLIPTHAVMWFGGHWLRQRATQDLRGLALLAGSALAASTLAYAISNGGFYWFSGRYAQPHLAEYLERFAMYLRGFLLVPCAYIAAAAIVNVAITRALGTAAESPDARR